MCCPLEEDNFPVPDPVPGTTPDPEPLHRSELLHGIGLGPDPEPVPVPVPDKVLLTSPACY